MIRPAFHGLCVRCYSKKHIGKNLVIVAGATRDNPIPVVCPICSGPATNISGSEHYIHCKIHERQVYIFELDKWYTGDGGYGPWIYKYHGGRPFRSLREEWWVGE